MVEYLEDKCIEDDSDDVVKKKEKLSDRAANEVHEKKIHDAKLTRKGWQIRKMRTRQEIEKMMNSIFKEFRFTTEEEDDFKTGYITTLYTSLKLCNDASISYRFFEKEMTSNYCMMGEAGISQQSQNNICTCNGNCSKNDEYWGACWVEGC